MYHVAICDDDRLFVALAKNCYIRWQMRKHWSWRFVNLVLVKNLC